MTDGDKQDRQSQTATKQSWLAWVDQFDTLEYRIVPLMFGEASLLTQPKAQPFGTNTSLGEIDVVPEITVVVYLWSASMLLEAPIAAAGFVSLIVCVPDPRLLPATM